MQLGSQRATLAIPPSGFATGHPPLPPARKCVPAGSAGGEGMKKAHAAARRRNQVEKSFRLSGGGYANPLVASNSSNMIRRSNGSI